MTKIHFENVYTTQTGLSVSLIILCKLTNKLEQTVNGLSLNHELLRSMYNNQEY